MALIAKVLYKLTRLEPPETPTQEIIPVKILDSFEGTKVTLGRERGQCPENAIYCRSDARHVSRRHCFLEFRNGDWFVADSQSGNGTFVNSERLPASTDKKPNFRKLEGGDRIGLGVQSFDREENDCPHVPLTEFYIFLFEKIIIKAEGGENCSRNTVSNSLDANVTVSNEVSSDPETEKIAESTKSDENNPCINDNDSSNTDDLKNGNAQAEENVGNRSSEEEEVEEHLTKSTAVERNRKNSATVNANVVVQKSAQSEGSHGSTLKTSHTKEGGTTRKKIFVLDSSSDSDEDASRKSEIYGPNKAGVNSKNPQVSLSKSKSPNQVDAVRHSSSKRRKTSGSDTESDEQTNDGLKQKGRRQRSTSSHSSDISSKISDLRGKKTESNSKKNKEAKCGSSLQKSGVVAKKRRDRSSSSLSQGSDKSETASKKRKPNSDTASESEEDCVFGFRLSSAKKNSSPKKKLRLSEDFDDFVVPDNVVEYEAPRKRKSGLEKKKFERNSAQNSVKPKKRNSSFDDSSNSDGSDFKAKPKAAKSAKLINDDKINRKTKKAETPGKVDCRREARKDFGRLDRGIVHQPEGHKIASTLESATLPSVGDLKPWELKQKEQELINRQPFIQIKRMFLYEEDGRNYSLDWNPVFLKKNSIKDPARIENQFLRYRLKHKFSPKRKGIIAKKFKVRRPEFRYDRGRIRAVSIDVSSDSEESVKQRRKSHLRDSSPEHHSVHQISSSEVSEVPNIRDVEPELSDAQAVSPGGSAGEESDKDGKRDGKHGKSPNPPEGTAKSPQKPRQAIIIEAMPVNPMLCRRRLLTGGPSSGKFKPSVSPIKRSERVNVQPDIKELRRQKLKDLALKNKTQAQKSMPAERDIIPLTTAKARVTANTRQDDMIRSMLKKP